MIFQTPFLPIDNLSRLMLLLIAFLFPMIFIYSLAYVKRNLFRYYFVLFITLGGIVGTILARDFLSFYVFLEIMTVGIYFLIIDNAKKESFPAGYKYILMMFTGGIFILLATLMLYNLTGTVAIPAIAKAAVALPQPKVLLIFSLFTIGCLFEIGAIPFHIWLPDAHPIAPSPVSALLSGVAIKIGAYGIIRLIFTLNILFPILVIIGVFSMLFGVVLALRQTNIKRLLAYSSISQMGYVLLGIGLGTGLGLGGSLFHIVNHATFKMLLFLCTGAIIFATGERELSKLGGLGKRMPVTLATFGIAALAISGIPPFNGFASKAVIAEAVSSNWLLKLVIVLTAAGTLATFLKLSRFTFFGSIPQKLKRTKEVPILMLLPMIILAGACLGIGLFPGQFFDSFIAPAISSGTAFSFWQTKIIVDTGVIIFLGLGIYFIGFKTGFITLQKKATNAFWSLDRICCDAAKLIEVGCVGLRKLHAKNLNVHLLWVFLTLVSVLIFLYFRADFLAKAIF